MKTALDHLPEGKRRELAHVVAALREGFAFAIERRTMPALRGGRLLKIILFGSYYGDMNWYAAVTTTDVRVVSAAGTTVDAVRRYYFDEQWRSPLPGPIAEVIQRALSCLENNGGSRRGRKPVPRASSEEAAN